MYAKHPDVAKKWDKEGKNYIKKGKKKGTYSKGAVNRAMEMMK